MTRRGDGGRRRFAGMRRGVLPAALLLIAWTAGAPHARADVDLTGTWQSVQFEIGASVPVLCSSVAVQQTGPALSMQGVLPPPCLGGAITTPGGLLLSGTIDPVTGVFTMSGSVSPNCTTVSFTATAAADGNTFSGTGTCQTSFGGGTVSMSVSGIRTPTCGNGVPDPFEECDDGNDVVGDCCDFCQLAFPGSSCVDDGNPCTADQCDAAGTCVHPPRPEGSACPGDGNACTSDECDGAGGCAHPPDAGAPCADDGNPCTRDVCDGSGACAHEGPRSDCRGAPHALLLVKHRADDDKDRLTWKWRRGAVTAAELGAPGTTTDYALCLYAGSAAARIDLPAGAAWRAAGARGFTYKDPAGTSDGAHTARVKSGEAGTAQALVKGKGDNLPDDLVPTLTLPLIAQLVSDDTGLCLESVFDAAQVRRNDDRVFKAKLP